ncbi:transglutaminase domain-containing protein, partial [bacterium]
MPLALLLAMAAFQAPSLDASLSRVPERKAEWRALLAKAPKAEREGLEYLLTYMPLADLSSLPTAKVAEWVHGAYVARGRTSWGPKLPKAVFLDAVVPYSSVTEPRQSMRAEWAKRYGPLVQRTKSPGEAALLINERLFKDTKVTYNTKRLRTDQSPPESIAQGMATCTGLSIMLVDALRAVGVPSRVAGIPSWPGRGGNHTWVEVWDKGDWHFVGAAEPDAKGLDHAWFAEEAGRVPGDKPNETIYAVTYKPTGTNFPLVWSRNATISAENATPRYQKNLAKIAPRLMVEV